MENWLTAPWGVILKTVVSVMVILVAMITIVRVSGLRTFAKMSSIDFASTIAIGSILAAVILNTEQSILKGTVALISIVLFQSTYTVLYRNSDTASHLITNSALLLMKDGEVLKSNLAKANIGMSDLMAKLREANVHQLNEVNAVVLETTGDVSVLHGSESKPIDACILKHVRDE